jgi:hypothetical protein
LAFPSTAPLFAPVISKLHGIPVFCAVVRILSRAFICMSM